MKYAIITVTDSNYLIRSQWDSVEGAIKSFHSLAAALWNDTGFSAGYVAIIDENLDIVRGYKEYITHTPVAPEEPTEE